MKNWWQWWFKWWVWTAFIVFILIVLSEPPRLWFWLVLLGASHVGMSIYTHEALWAEKGKDR
jgi:uncharacterized membrane protein YjjB (DUF3815 family)